MKYCPECGHQLASPPTQNPTNIRQFRYGSWKFWETWREGYVVWVRFGRLGANGTLHHKEFDWQSDAADYQQKKIGEKLNNGYHEVYNGRLPEW